MIDSFFHAPIALVAFSVMVSLLPMVVEMLHFLGQFVFVTLRLLMAVVFTQFVDVPLLLHYPAFEAFVFFTMMTLATVSLSLLVFVFTLAMEMLHFLGQFAFQAFGFLMTVVLM